MNLLLVIFGIVFFIAGFASCYMIIGKSKYKRKSVSQLNLNEFQKDYYLASLHFNVYSCVGIECTDCIFLLSVQGVFLCGGCINDFEWSLVEKHVKGLQKKTFTIKDIIQFSKNHSINEYIGQI